MSLPSDSKARKALPLWSGFVAYFPDVVPEVARISQLGNDQHNPGEPLHWSRGKSDDHLDSAFRHMLDHQQGDVRDSDGTYHLGKAIWRLCAQLQLQIEADRQQAGARS